MPLAGTALADAQPLDVAAQFDDLAGKFMARDQRHRHGLGRPVVPVPDMHIGAADAGLVRCGSAHRRGRSRAPGARSIHRPGSWLGLDQSLHVVLHSDHPDLAARDCERLQRPVQIVAASGPRSSACGSGPAPSGTTGKKKPGDIDAIRRTGAPPCPARVARRPASPARSGARRAAGRTPDVPDLSRQ